MASPLPSHLLTYSEVADVLRVQIRQVRILVSAGLLAYTLIGVRRRRIPRESLERYLASRTFQNAPRPALAPPRGIVSAIFKVQEVPGIIHTQAAQAAELNPAAWNTRRKSKSKKSTA